jgi:hypothetical protein
MSMHNKKNSHNSLEINLMNSFRNKIIFNIYPAFNFTDYNLSVNLSSGGRYFNPKILNTSASVVTFI